MAARLAELGVPAILWARRAEAGIEAADLLADARLPDMPRRLDAIIHLAAHAVPGPGFLERHAEENIALCARMLDAAQGRAARFVLASSAHVYAPSDKPHQEDAPLAPATPYGRSKLACEELCRAQQRTEPRIARLFGTAGPGLPRGLMLADALESALRGDDPVVMRGPDGWRDILDVRDAADALVGLALAPSAGACVANIASGRARRSSDLVQTMLSALPRPPRVAWPAGEALPLRADVARIAALCGFSPRRELDQCLRSMALRGGGLQDETGSAIVQG